MQGVTREQLLSGYRRPYRRWLPLAYRLTLVRQLAALAALLVLVTLGMEALGDGAPAELVTAAILVSVGALGLLAYITAAAVRAIRARTRQWRPGTPGPLERARRARGHAGDADPTVAHDEYAVVVADDGRLQTWRLEPLTATEATAADELVLAGVPRWTASVVAEAGYDPRDAGAAAEALHEAQQDAAARERAAIERAQRLLADRADADELRTEATSTRDALRRLTGQ